MATAFISWGTIGEVYAWNGTASYLIGIDEHIGFFNINYTIEHSFDIEKELYVDSLIMLGKVMVYSVIGSRVEGLINGLQYGVSFADASTKERMILIQRK